MFGILLTISPHRATYPENHATCFSNNLERCCQISVKFDAMSYWWMRCNTIQQQLSTSPGLCTHTTVWLINHQMTTRNATGN